MKVEQGLSLAAVTQAAVCAPDHVVAYVQGQPWSRARWLQQVLAWRAAFAQVQGTDVALYFEDAVAFSAALWGAWHAGKTPVLLSDAQPHTLECLLPTVRACAGDVPGALQPLELNDHETLLSANTCAWPALDLQVCQVVMFTSGSTGQPERITKQLRQLDAEVHALQSAFGSGAQADWQVVATVSHQHIYGLLFRVLWPLSAGRPMGSVMLRYPEEVVQALAAHPSNILVSSPAFLSRLPEHLAWRVVAPHLVQIFSSGGPLAAHASAHCQQWLSCSPTEVFGSSETGGIAWRRRAEHGETWQLLPGVQVQVVAAELEHARDAAEVAPACGVLTVLSPHLLDPAAWWRTADRAEVSADGRSFVLQGRADRIVKIAEKRVSLTAMEHALLALDSVQLAKAVVLESPDASARIGMVLELTEAGWQQLMQQGRRAMAQGLRQHLSAYVERVALPRQWRYMVRMPVNAQSKTTQHALQQLFHPSVPQPQWLQRSADEAVAALWIDPKLRVLEGHFPQATLVPGVAQLHWVVQMGQQAFGLEPRFTRADVLKFQQPILPGDTVQLALNWDAAAQRLQFALTSERGPHASGKLVQVAA